ncbi:MAG: 6,7-dimethyl-8-ribityllumazine synthase [Rhodospirillaceae bacterium]
MNQVPQHKTITAAKIAFIQAAWHTDILNKGYDAFVDHIQAASQSIEVQRFTVPGALEIPLLGKTLATSGTYAAIVGCAFVVDGGIYRHEFVATAVLGGLMQAQLDTGVPILSMVLTPHHFSASDDHQMFFLEHFKIKGREAADACLAVLKTYDELKQDLKAVA